MERDLPEAVHAIANKANKKHPADIDKAAALALSEIEQLDDFDDFRDILVARAVRGLIHEVRHSGNRIIKAPGEPVSGSDAKVVVGSSSAVARASLSAYTMSIAGRMVGMILGEELDAIAAAEAATGRGHLANAEIFRRVRAHTPDGKRVRDCLTEKKLQAIIDDVMAANGATLAIGVAPPGTVSVGASRQPKQTTAARRTAAK